MHPAEKLIRENLETKLSSLDLGRCGLGGTESFLTLLAECSHLETLILANEWEMFDTFSVFDVETTHYSQNTGDNNTLVVLPCLPTNLKKL